jgi:hypothetical protein
MSTNSFGSTALMGNVEVMIENETACGEITNF